ncbi:MAG: hypothetical protein K9G76_03490 [Bacteroidales bacterium]|nr:hypothetical protein [Bacteroidales bacterium]MCF8402857.1 hypothetical protein [Bacteroidales bacterium]
MKNRLLNPEPSKIPGFNILIQGCPDVPASHTAAKGIPSEGSSSSL